jgi:hypothetical protein
MKAKLVTGLLAAALSLAAADAFALTIITPSSGTLNVTRWELDGSPANPTDAQIGVIVGSTTTLQYKSDVSGGSGNGADSGPFAASYNTTFSNAAGDPADADINWVNGQPSLSCLTLTCYLLVKDGNQTPDAYIFNLSALGYDGTEDLDLRGFWPGNGAISHIAIYTGPGAGSGGGSGQATVPEPASLLLLGTGLSAAAWRVRRRRQAAQTA